LEVFNTLGQKVAEPWAEAVVPGVHRVSWDGTGTRGEGVASGIYFVRVNTSAGASATTKVVLIR
jgi:flagellar hook assembly protein FlgD